MKRTIIIAEAGVNHNGDLQNAFKLVDAAAEAGVDYVKFQTFKAENLVAKSAKKADYQVKNTADEVESQLEMLKKLELSQADHEKIINYANEKNVKFFSTAFDLESLAYLKSIGFTLVKIPSGEITNYPYLKLAAQLFKEVIISTGMSSLTDIQQAIEVFYAEGISKDAITVLHCNTEYPTPMDDVNLLAMLQIKNEFGTSVGYSDHTLGIEVPIAAVALGAKVIEKHFTLDRNMPGPDHAASLEPDDLKQMVSAIRNIEAAISGSGIKEPSKSEIKNMSIARKSIVAAVKINKGELLTADNLTTKRPGTGISAMEWENVIGKYAAFDFEADDLIEF